MKTLISPKIIFLTVLPPLLLCACSSAEQTEAVSSKEYYKELDQGEEDPGEEDPGEEYSGEDSPEVEDPYWSRAEELLEDYVAEGYEVSLFWVQDTAYLEENDLTGEKIMLYQCQMKGEGEMDVPFCVWVRETPEGRELETDFKNCLFRWALLNAYQECETDLMESWNMPDYVSRDCSSYIILWKEAQRSLEEAGGLRLYAELPADSGYASPYYGCLGEDVILCSTYDADEWEPVFRAAYEKVHEYQQLISGDLSQNVRFTENYHPRSYRGDAGEASDSNTTAWLNNVFRLTYETWLEDYEAAGGREYLISFAGEYGEEQRELLETMCRDRDSRNINYEIYIVQKGDTLWGIAEKYWGDGRECYRIYRENADVIGNDMDFILPGMSLRLYLLKSP